MPETTTDKSTAVLLANGQEIGRLRYTGGDMFWLQGSFTPLPAFEWFRPLFQRLEAAWTADEEGLSGEEAERAQESRFELQARVDALVTVRDASGATRLVHDFKLTGGKFEHKLAGG
jgi:hypothetical protein